VSVIKEWNQQRVMSEMSGKVLNGMDKACAFAAEQARGNAPRRTGNLADNIDYEVVPVRDNIEGRVGIKGGAMSASQGKAFYGRFIELGTKRQPARPFLRPAVYDNGDEIVRLIAEG